MTFPSYIFKAYDIRGLAETELSENLAYLVGCGFGKILSEKNDLDGKYVVVANDMRDSSPKFKDAVVRGLNDFGLNVVDIGDSTTPLFNFACANYAEHAGGIMVTASHNPAEYNGFKMTYADGLPLGKGSGMDELRDLVLTGNFSDLKKKGHVKKKEVLADYLARVFSLVSPENIRPLRVVIDCGNGMGRVTFQKLAERLPITVDWLYADPDGSFPNHEANPLKSETLRDLQKKVLETRADFGFALDGDADRIGLVDEKGEVVDASFVAALIGLQVLQKHPGGLCLYDLRSSKIASEVWQAAGARTEMCMVGHALIKKMLREKKAVFASELSLHLYYADMYGVESSDLSFLYILGLLSQTTEPLSSLVLPLKKYYHSGEINFEVEDKAIVLSKIKEAYGQEAVETSNIDGLWLQLPWGWLSLRESNTEPVLRLNLESVSAETTQKKVAEVRRLIEG